MSTSQPQPPPPPAAAGQPGTDSAESSSVQLCTVCGQHFTRIDHLRRHELSHSFPQHQCPHPSCGMLFHRRDVMKRHLAVHEPSPTKKRRRARRGAVPVISQSRLGQRSTLGSDGSDGARSSTHPAIAVQPSPSTSARLYQHSTQVLPSGSYVSVSSATDGWAFDTRLAGAQTYPYGSYGIESSGLEPSQADAGNVYGTLDATGLPPDSEWTARHGVAQPSEPVVATVSYIHRPGAYTGQYHGPQQGGYS